MKRLFVPFVLIVIVSLACSLTGVPTTAIPPIPPVSSPVPQENGQGENASAYTSPTCAEAMCLTDSFSLPNLQNRGLGENILKLFSVAVDEERNLVYVAGIMTPNVAILDGKTETWVGVVQTGIAERSIKYIYFDSAAQYLYIFESERASLRRVNVATGEIVGPVSLDGGFGNLAFVDEVHTRLYLNTKNGLTAFDGNSLAELYIVNSLGKNAGPMVYDKTTDSIYMLASQDKLARSIVVINAENGQVTGEINYDNQAQGRGGWLHFDSEERIFVIGLEKQVIYLDMNGEQTRAFPLQRSGVLADILYDPATDQTFVLSVSEPEAERVAGIGGQVDVYDKSGSLTSYFDFGRKPHTMRLNPANGHIYIANGDASVLWSIDAAAPTQANPLRLGDSVEQIIVSGDGGTLYLASRLGGSYIARYDLSSNGFETFTAGTWPIPLRRDTSGEHLFALNAWDSTLSVYSMTPQQSLLGTIPLGLPAGSTDRLPDLAIDSTHKLAYAAYPEFGVVAVANWETMQPVTTLSIPNAKTGDTGGGPGQLQVIVNESANRLFVYEPQARAVHVYDTANNYALLASVDLKAQAHSIGQTDADLFFFDVETNRLFLGPVELDSVSAQPTGNSLPAGNKIFGVDAASNFYWVMDSANSAILAIDRATLAIRHSQPMPESSSMLATAAYDPIHRQVFVGYLITANVYVLTIGQIP